MPQLEKARAQQRRPNAARKEGKEGGREEGKERGREEGDREVKNMF